MLESSEINVYYGDIQALWNVTFAIKPGEIVTLVGSNGSGKSTIMRSIAGLVKPRRGSITFEGERLDKLPSHRIVEMGISMVPEGRRIFPGMTVEENLEVGASSKSSSKHRGTTMEWIYNLFPILQTRSHQPAGTLSGGEQQMLAIGRALMTRPKLLTIDEMSLGLSPIAVQEICRALQEINKEKELAIFLVEQDVHLALSVASRGYIIENGRVIREGDTKALLCDAGITEAYLGCKLDEGKD